MKKLLISTLILFIYLPLQAADTKQIKIDTLNAVENYNNGNYKSASKSFAELYYEMKKIVPKDINARFKFALYAGLSYLELNDYSNALAWFNTCIALHKKSPSLYDYATLEVFRADTLNGLKKTDLALSSYSNILSNYKLSDNDKAVILYKMANIYATSKDDLNKATILCNNAKLSTNVKDHKSLIARCEIINGKYYEMLKDIQKAENSFNNVIKFSTEIDLNFQAYIHLASLHETNNNHYKARINYENALFLIIENGLNEDIYSISDKIISLMPEKENALTQANRMRYLASLEFVDDKYRAILYRLSAIYYKISGDMNNLFPTSEEGEAYLSELKIILKHKEEYRLELAFYIAYALTELGEYEDALAIALKLKNNSSLKKLKGFDFELEEILAINYFKLNNIIKAKEHIEKAKKLFPQNAKEEQRKRLDHCIRLIG